MFFFNDTATTEIYTLSLHDALPIFLCARYTQRETTATKVHRFPSAHSNAGFDGSLRTARRISNPALERSEEHTSELQSQSNLVCRLLLEKKKKHYLCTRLHLLPHAG